MLLNTRLDNALTLVFVDVQKLPIIVWRTYYIHRRTKFGRLIAKMCRVRKRPEHYYTETEEPENKTCFLCTDLLVKSQNDKDESAE